MCHPAAGQARSIVRAAGPSEARRASKNTDPKGEMATLPKPTMLVDTMTATAITSGIEARHNAARRSATTTMTVAAAMSRCVR